MTQQLCNLHNHTPFSDGAYSIDELCAAHLSLTGVQIVAVGISDHLFCTPSSREPKDEREFVRIFGREARRYREMVLEARARWSGRVTVLCGCEITWPHNRPFIARIATLLEGFDYCLFSYCDWAGLTQLAHHARRFPCPVGLAITDVRERFPNTPMEQVVRTLANARIFYEVNSKLAPLARHDAWFRTLARHRVRLTLGTDTHDDIECIGDLKMLADFLEQRELADRLFVPAIAQPEQAVAGH